MPAAVSLLKELTTPLTVVMGFLDLAKDEEDGEVVKCHLEIAERNLQLLAAAIAAIETELRLGR